VNIRTRRRLSQSKMQQFPELDENVPVGIFRRFFPQPGPMPSPRPGPVPRARGRTRVPRGRVRASSFRPTLRDDESSRGRWRRWITVTLPDKREFKGHLVGSDQRSDVAMVKIDGTALPSSKIGVRPS